MKNILIFLMLFSGFAATAQVEITGTVTDQQTQAPLEFAEIILLTDPPSNLIGVISDLDGHFKLTADPATYTLKVIYLGQTLYTKELTLTENIDLGTIETVNAIQLDDITVTARRKLIHRKIDRLVFDVENSTKASQGDALEVLKVTPGVHVQNDEINMVGKSTMSVMIDDKIVQLSKDDLANFLKSIASEDIKSIEVITTPPAKYEAVGNSGLINITLKKAKEDSWNAQVKTGYIQRRAGMGTLGGNFNFNKNKLSIASSVYYRNGTYHQEQDDYAYFPDALWYTSSPFKSSVEGLNARMDLNYQVSPNWSMGGQYLFNGLDLGATDAPYTPVFDNVTGEITRSLESEGRVDTKPRIHSLNFNNSFTLDTLGRNLTLNIDYFTYDNPDVKTYNGISEMKDIALKQYYRGTNTNEQDITNMSAKLDLEYPTSFANLSVGGKISQSKSLNDIAFFNSGLVSEPVTELPISENDFEYTENIQALYFSANKMLNPKWSTQLGVRLEATQTNSVSNNLDFSEKNDYIKLFPTFYLAYNATENSTYALTYSKRIQRPLFFELNPNIYFINPFQTIEGNAFLQPAFVDNIELSNTYKNLSSKLYYSYEDNLFSQVPLPNSSTNVIRFTNENYINTQRFGLSESYMFNVGGKWSSNVNFDMNYAISEFNLSQEQAQPDQKGFNTSVSTYNNIILNPSRTLLLGVNYWYNFAGVDGIFDTKASSSLALAIHWALMDRKLNVSLIANDVFKTSAERKTTTVNGVFQEARYYYDARSVMLSVSYKFGNNKIQAKKHKTGNEEERGRTGN